MHPDQGPGQSVPKYLRALHWHGESGYVSAELTTRTLVFDFNAAGQITWTVDQDYFIRAVFWSTNVLNTRALLTTDKAKTVSNLASQTARLDCICVCNNQSGSWAFTNNMRHPIKAGELLCCSTGSGTNNQLVVILEYANDPSANGNA
jgi:hypothetical protein